MIFDISSNSGRLKDLEGLKLSELHRFEPSKHNFSKTVKYFKQGNEAGNLISGYSKPIPLALQSSILARLARLPCAGTNDHFELEIVWQHQMTSERMLHLHTAGGLRTMNLV